MYEKTIGNDYRIAERWENNKIANKLNKEKSIIIVIIDDATK